MTGHEHTETLTPQEMETLWMLVGKRLTGLVKIAADLDENDPDQLADKAWLVGTAEDVRRLCDAMLAGAEARDAEHAAALAAAVPAADQRDEAMAIVREALDACDAALRSGRRFTANEIVQIAEARTTFDHLATALSSREEVLEDAIRDMLDFTAEWCSPMGDAEKLAAIQRIGTQALRWKRAEIQESGRPKEDGA